MHVVVSFYIEMKHVFDILFHIHTRQLALDQEGEEILCLPGLLVSMTAEMEITNLEDIDFFYYLLLYFFPKLLYFSARGRRR